MPEEAQSTDQQTPAKEVPKNISHKINWLHVLIGVIAGVILIGAGFGVYLLTQSKSGSTNEPNQVSTSSAKQATPSAKKDETAGWKTYTSIDSSYSFKYPEGWKLKTNNDLVSVECAICEGETNIDLFQIAKVNHPIIIRLISEYITSIKGSGARYDITKTTLAGKEAVRSIGNQENGSLVVWFVVIKEEGYEMFYNYPKVLNIKRFNKIEKPVPDIISTIKFLPSQ